MHVAPGTHKSEGFDKLHGIVEAVSFAPLDWSEIKRRTTGQIVHNVIGTLDMFFPFGQIVQAEGQTPKI